MGKMTETENLAVFCDFENVAIGVRDARPPAVVGRPFPHQVQVFVALHDGLQPLALRGMAGQHPRLDVQHTGNVHRARERQRTAEDVTPAGGVCIIQVRHAGGRLCRAVMRSPSGLPPFRPMRISKSRSG